MVPSLHPIDVENYDATPDIILIASDDDEDYDIEEYVAAAQDNEADDVIVIPSDMRTAAVTVVSIVGIFVDIVQAIKKKDFTAISIPSYLKEIPEINKEFCHFKKEGRNSINNCQILNSVFTDR
nr:hypothetical protein [Tanacetum cinerariifolium]